jgi:hypothetical protein
MSTLVRFSPQGMTTDQYDAIKGRLSEEGHWPPDGLEYHLCFADNGQLRVSEVWSSAEQLEAFGQHLMPILKDAGVNMSGPPDSFDVYNQEWF